MNASLFTWTRVRTNSKIDGEIEQPILEYPHHDTECAEIPFHLFGHVRLLDLDRHPLAGCKFCTVDLCNAGTRDRFLFEYVKDAIRTCGRATKFGLEDRQDGRIGYLRCVVK